eukprot:jgi/Astpho2/692/e_gw1.00013.139.1_t
MLRELLAATVRGATKVKQLSPKRGPRNYYKGKGAASVGHHTKKGERQSACYKLLPEKQPDFVVPDLKDFKVRS